MNEVYGIVEDLKGVIESLKPKLERHDKIFKDLEIAIEVIQEHDVLLEKIRKRNLMIKQLREEVLHNRQHEMTCGLKGKCPYQVTSVEYKGKK